MIIADADAGVDAALDAALDAYSSHSNNMAAACVNDCLARVPCLNDNKEESFVAIKTLTKRK